MPQGQLLILIHQRTSRGSIYKIGKERKRFFYRAERRERDRDGQARF